MTYTFDNIRKGGYLLYEYIRGSQSFGLETPTSDTDTGGIFIVPRENLYGFKKDIIEQIKDEKQDNKWYELARYIELLIDSDPSVLESLFVEDRCVLYEDPIITELKKHKEEFLTKKTLRALSGYAFEQIKKARGYNKLCSYPENMERKEPLDFCYVHDGYQGSMPVKKWLEKNGLKQIYCGLNNLPNMPGMKGLFYDYAQHIKMEYKTLEEFEVASYNAPDNAFWKHVKEDIVAYYSSSERVYDMHNYEDYYNSLKPKGYHGIVKEDGSSCDIHLNTIEKGDYPLILLSYNKDGYVSHCTQYKQWAEWKEVRNKERYESNFGTGYDSKNMMHCIRLLTMAVEIADGKGFNMNRRLMGDREYLLDVKQHKYTYEELLAHAEDLNEQVKKKIKTCTLPDKVDTTPYKELLTNLRKEFYEKLH